MYDGENGFEPDPAEFDAALNELKLHAAKATLDPNVDPSCIDLFDLQQKVLMTPARTVEQLFEKFKLFREVAFFDGRLGSGSWNATLAAFGSIEADAVSFAELAQAKRIHDENDEPASATSAPVQ